MYKKIFQNRPKNLELKKTHGKFRTMTLINTSFCKALGRAHPHTYTHPPTLWANIGKPVRENYEKP